MESFKPNKIALGKMRRESIYGSVEWKEYRLRYLHHNPTCYCCGEKSTVVDHIIAHKGKKELFESVYNHLPLCATCHNTITALFDRGRIDQASVERKARWILRRRKENNLRSKVKVLLEYK